MLLSTSGADDDGVLLERPEGSGPDTIATLLRTSDDASVEEVVSLSGVSEDDDCRGALVLMGSVSSALEAGILLLGTSDMMSFDETSELMADAQSSELELTT